MGIHTDIFSVRVYPVHNIRSVTTTEMGNVNIYEYNYGHRLIFKTSLKWRCVQDEKVMQNFAS